ncbi:hypothetical protein LTR85_001338 [Meristemomyces frigidus]|nr:hypothetical protein LTR85_001338 [Meristemomyces frigidus]
MAPPDRSTFRFLDLPPELRNIIYELALTNCKIRLANGRPTKAPGICHVNRQINEEVFPLSCRYSTIVFRVRDMDFRQVIRCMQAFKGACRKALLANPRLTILMDGYSARRSAHDGLLEWLRFRNKHLRSRKPVVHWTYEVIEGPCRRNPPWETGDWFLLGAGYYELMYLHEYSGDPYDKRTLSELLRALWNFAHPEVSF